MKSITRSLKSLSKKLKRNPRRPDLLVFSCFLFLKVILNGFVSR